jgi:hypothetical protein
MTGEQRPADHPLVELGYDVLGQLNLTGVHTLARSSLARRRMRDVLRSARALIVALEHLVDELDQPSPGTAGRTSVTTKDYQTISVD